MTPEQQERALIALEGINTTLQNITNELIALREHIGTIDETWEPTSYDYKP